MSMNYRKISLLLLVLAVSFTLNIVIGSDISSIGKIFSSGLMDDIILKIRLPRAVTALIAGGTFALCGAVFQSLFRNPIASPFTLGTAGGASFGVTLYISFFSAASFGGITLTTVSAFAGALLSVAIVYAVSSGKRSFNPNTMILSGVVINFFFSGLILLVQYITDQANAVRITRWTMGSIDLTGTGQLTVATLIFITGFAVIYGFRNDLNLLSLGEEISVSRGVETDRSRRSLFLNPSALSGSSPLI